MSDKKTYEWDFDLFEKTWSLRGRPCPDCVNESNWRAWRQYLSRLISKHLCIKTMQTKEFLEELEAVRKNEEERLANRKKLDEAAEVRRRRSCMERPKDRLCTQRIVYRPGGSIRQVFPTSGDLLT